MEKRNLRKIAWIVLLILLAGIAMAGCKIETPEEAALNAQITQDAFVGETAESQSMPRAEAAETAVSATLTPEAGASPEEEYIDADYVDENGGDDVSQSDYDKYENGEVSEYDANESGGKDQYLTDPIPAGKPKPVEWQDAVVDKSVVEYCTLSISCSTILNNMDQFNEDKLDVLPADGIILSERQVAFYKGESVFDMLLRETQSNRIQMEYEMTPIYNSNYIEGIHNLYEFDCGELSGWMYKVNGWFPNYGCSRYQLQNGDVVNWVYTCDLGRDVGNEWMGDTVE